MWHDKHSYSQLTWEYTLQAYTALLHPHHAFLYASASRMSYPLHTDALHTPSEALRIQPRHSYMPCFINITISTSIRQYSIERDEERNQAEIMV